MAAKWLCLIGAVIACKKHMAAARTDLLLATALAVVSWQAEQKL